MEIRQLIAFGLGMHGIGHLLGVATISLGLLHESGFTQNSWILTGRLGINSTFIKVLGILWLLTAILFTYAAYGYYYDLAWWSNE